MIEIDATPLPEGAPRAASPLPDIRPLTYADLGHALRAGVRDFRTAPRFGIFFSAVYVLGGFLMVWLGAGTVVWTLAASLGFPLVAPFAAAGLYEVSRRLEQGEPLTWEGSSASSGGRGRGSSPGRGRSSSFTSCSTPSLPT